MEKKRLFVGAGGAGNNLLHDLTQKTKLINKSFEAVYINFAESDVSDKFKGVKFVLSEGGSGRDINRGREIARKYNTEIREFFESLVRNPTQYVKADKKNQDWQPDEIVLLASLGGGTGASLITEALDAIGNQIDLVIVGVFPSVKEGVATLPNSIKAFQAVYNDYILTDRAKSLFLFDNEKYVKDYGCDLTDYNSINDVMINQIETLLDETPYSKSSDGYSSLDVAERNRVLFFGKGLSDYSVHNFTDKELIASVEFSEDDPEKVKTTLKHKSSIFSSNYSWKTAKAVGIEVLFKKISRNVSKDVIDAANATVTGLKKQFKNAFAVHGYTFGNEITSDVEIRIFLNGLDVPKVLTADTKKAVKAVETIKVRNDEFDVDGADLDF